MLLNFKKISEKIHEWSCDLEMIPVVGPVIRKSKSFTLPGFQHMPLYDVMRYFFDSLGKGIIFQRAAALTYRIFMALIPMLIAFFSVIAFLGSGVHQTIMSMFESIVPTYAWSAVEAILSGIVLQQHGTLSILMFVFGLYFTVLCCNALLAAMNIAYYNEERRRFVKQILLSAGIMVIFFFVLLLVVGAFVLASLAIKFIQQSVSGPEKLYVFLVVAVKWLLTYAALYFLVSILYYLAPVNKKNYRFFSAGSTTCTVLMVLLLWVLNVYFSNFSNYNLIYGSLGALFAIMLWINWSSLIFLIGFDLNVSIAKAKQEKQLFDAPKELPVSGRTKEEMNDNN